MNAVKRKGAIVAALVFTLGALATTPVRAERLNMRFDVRVGGIKVFKVDYEGRLTAHEYTGRARIKPSGFGGLFISSRSDMRVRGRMGNPSVKPESFYMLKGKKRKTKEATVSFSGGAVANWKRTPPQGADRRAAIRQAISGRRVLDPLSMLVQQGLKDPKAFCTGRQRIFDGHSVYDLVFRREGTKPDPRTGGTLYRCRIIYVPVAGMSEKKKRRAKADPPFFDVWFAKVKDRDAGTLLVPVSATGRLNGKGFAANMKRGRIGGEKLAARMVR